MIQQPIDEHRKQNARPNHQPKRKYPVRVQSHRVAIVRPVDPIQEVLVVVVQQIAHRRIHEAPAVQCRHRWHFLMVLDSNPQL